MKCEQRNVYVSGGALFQIHVTVEVVELIVDRPSIPASAKDILPEHRQEIVKTMAHLAQRIHAEEIP